MNWYFKVLQNYAQFKGRASRTEYWTYTGIDIGVFAVLLVIDSLIGANDPYTFIGFLSTIYALATIVPKVALAFRRLHDSGRSGKQLLIGIGIVCGLSFLRGAFTLVASVFLFSLNFFLLASAIGIIGFVFTALQFVVLLYFVYLFIQPSQPGPNPYGENPHEPQVIVQDAVQP